MKSKGPSDDRGIETVRCLSCGQAYSKLAGKGTVEANPGCPDCGYVGWALAESPVLTEGLARRHSSADPPPRRSA